MYNLDNLRKEIDSIDKEMVTLFEKRMEIVSAIALYKKENHLPIEHASRENEVLNKNLHYLKNEVFQDSLIEFFKSLMKISKEFQSKL